MHFFSIILLMDKLLEGFIKSTKPDKKTKIDSAIDYLFEANCDSSASSVQTIEFNDLSFVARGNCEVVVRNKATVNSSCNLTDIIKQFTDAVLQADDDLAKLLQGTATSSDVDELKTSIVYNLEQKCVSQVDAKQTLRILGGNHSCDDQARLHFEQETNLQATCLKSVLTEAIDKQSPPAPPPNTTTDYTAIIIIVIVCVIFLLSIIFFALFRYRT